MRNVANNTGTEAPPRELKPKNWFLKDNNNSGPLVHHDSTINVTVLTSIKHINDTEAVWRSWLVLYPTAQHLFFSPSFMVTTTHVVFHKGL